MYVMWQELIPRELSSAVSHLGPAPPAPPAPRVLTRERSSTASRESRRRRMPHAKRPPASFEPHLSCSPTSPCDSWYIWPSHPICGGLSEYVPTQLGFFSWKERPGSEAEEALPTTRVIA